MNLKTILAFFTTFASSFPTVIRVLKYIALAVVVFFVIKFLFVDFKVQGYFELGSLKKKAQEILSHISGLEEQRAEVEKENATLKAKDRITQLQYQQMQKTYEGKLKAVQQRQASESITNITPKELESKLRALEIETKDDPL